MSPLQEVIQLLKLDNLDDPNEYAIRLNGKRVFVNKWDMGTSFLKEINQEELWQIVGILKIESGRLSSNSIEDFLMIKYIKPYVVRINFPPTSSDYYIDIYKIGLEPSINARISGLWEGKTAYNWLRDFLMELKLI
jgi:hypothetical protein